LQSLRASSVVRLAWSKRTCAVRDELRRGTAFAASRCAGWDEARTLRVPVFALWIKEYRRRPRFSRAARDDVRILPPAPALLHERWWICV